MNTCESMPPPNGLVGPEGNGPQPMLHPAEDLERLMQDLDLGSRGMAAYTAEEQQLVNQGMLYMVGGAAPNSHFNSSPQDTTADAALSQQQQQPQHPWHDLPSPQGVPPLSRTLAPTTSTPSSMTTPSPSAMLLTSLRAHSQAPPLPAPSVRSAGFDEVVADPMDYSADPLDFTHRSLDASIFGEPNLDFERDFYAWFAPEQLQDGFGAVGSDPIDFGASHPDFADGAWVFPTLSDDFERDFAAWYGPEYVKEMSMGHAAAL